MGRNRTNVASNEIEPMRPALTPRGREDQCIALAINLAEKQLAEGTASSQVITHYLKRDAERRKNELELQILEKQKELVEAKTESIRASQSNDEMYEKAINAMREYSGNLNEREDY